MVKRDVSGPSQVRSKETKTEMVVRRSAETQDCGRGAAEGVEGVSYHRTVLEQGER